MNMNMNNEEEEKKSTSWNESTSAVNSALKKYEQSVGLAYDDLPSELCEGTNLKLARWSLVVTDNSLKTIAQNTYNRVKRDLDDKEKNKMRNKMTLEEELAELDSLTFEPTEEVQVTQKLSKKKTRLEQTLEDTLSGGVSGPTAEEQNMEEENLKAQQEAAERVRWENQMKKTGLLSLDIAGSQLVTDTGIKALADVCITLQSLNVEGSYRITDVGLRTLAMSCVHLRDLNFSGCMGVAGPGFAVLGEVSACVCACVYRASAQQPPVPSTQSNPSRSYQ